MRLRHVGVTVWIATAMVHVALTADKTESKKATNASICKDLVTLHIMKTCSKPMRLKRDVGEQTLPRRLPIEMPDLSVQSFVPGTNKAYARRQLQQRKSDVAMPMSDTERNLYTERDDRRQRFSNPSSSLRIRRRYPYSFDIENPSGFESPLTLLPIDEPELNPLNEEDLDDLYNDLLLYERTPRDSPEETMHFTKMHPTKCCHVRMCKMEYYFNMTSYCLKKLESAWGTD